MTSLPRTLVIGAGPAGLTAAYLLSKRGYPVTVLEADEIFVGGLSRTANYKGFLFDMGGHRFFSKSREVEELWSEILPNDFLERPRCSRIYYDRTFFSYPLRPLEALMKLGPLEAAHRALSYAKSRIRPVSNPDNFEDWIKNQFGSRLFEIFFKTYTEKVWGMDCREISADWAAQRIKGLSLSSALLNALKPRAKDRNAFVKTLIDTFRYPRRGPGMMWEACTNKIREQGGQVQLGRRVTRCQWNSSVNEWQVASIDETGRAYADMAQHIVTSAALREIVAAISPSVDAEAIHAASLLRYRNFLIVVLIVEERNRFNDNWVYIQDGSVKVGRIQNFRSWSSEMVPDPKFASYGCEYFCQPGDGIWESSDETLMELARREMSHIGLIAPADVVDATVVGQPKAYPVYDAQYSKHVGIIRDELRDRFPTFHTVDRNGMHKYNNQDHSMMTTMLCVENIVAGYPVYDLWHVNQDAEYHEAGERGEGGRMVPRPRGTQANVAR